MIVQVSHRFERAYGKLSKADKVIVRKAVELLAENPRHPGLQVKKMEGGDVWEARCSLRLRMTFDLRGDVPRMRVVGEHDKMLKNP